MTSAFSYTTARGAEVTVNLVDGKFHVAVNGTDKGIATITRFNPSYAEIVIPGVGKAPVSNAQDVDRIKGLLAEQARGVVKHNPHDKHADETSSEWLSRQMYSRNGKFYG